MATIDQPTINGNLYSFASITVKVNGDDLVGFTEITYGDNLEIVKGHGSRTAKKARGRTQGAYQTDPVALKGHKDSIDALRNAFDDGTGYIGGTEVEIVVQYEEPSLGVVTDTIERCRWMKNSNSNTEGADPTIDEVELDCLGIRWNGKTLYRPD